MDLAGLTQKLVAIPSYVDPKTGHSEVCIGKFVAEYLANLGYLQVRTEVVDGDRFNVIARDDSDPRLFFGCHLDTVMPSGQWQFDPFAGTIVGDRLYGLGACDMKGGIAALLRALAQTKHTHGLYLLFDIDEESDFLGMNDFLKRNSTPPYTELAIFPEPGLAVGNGHRGLVEVRLRIRGRSGHAARPEEGKNAIFGAVDAVRGLIRELDAFSHHDLGASTCNLAWLRGGIETNGEISDNQPNKIPDIAEIILDIRPADARLRADTVIELISAKLKEGGFELTETRQIRHDKGSLYTDPSELTDFVQIARTTIPNLTYDDIGKSGYTEAQMLNERWGSKVVIFGPGPKELHKPDEFVSIRELEMASQVYQDLIAHYC